MPRTAEQVKAALARVSGVGRAEVLDSEGDRNYVRIALRGRDGNQDIREEVARTVISNGWPLREIRLEHATLEEFFVEVTARQAMAKAGSGNAPTTTDSRDTHEVVEPVAAEGGVR